MLNLKPYFILAGLDRKGEHVYHAIDNHSGGYPYWSPFISSAKQIESEEQVSKLIDDRYVQTDQITSMTIYRVEPVVTVFSEHELISAKKAKAIKELQEINALRTAKLRELEELDKLE